MGVWVREVYALPTNDSFPPSALFLARDSSPVINSAIVPAILAIVLRAAIAASYDSLSTNGAISDGG
jgi:hypothetical protein